MNDDIKYAILENGDSIPYVYVPNPPHGGMKHTYFAPDKSYVVQFYNNPQRAVEMDFIKRLKAITTKYNPTISEEEGGAHGNTKELAQYFKKRFCWPIAIVEKPEYGIVCPAYPSNFYFDKNSSKVLNLNGKDKKSTWFTYKNRRYIEKEETGDILNILKMSLMLARAIRRLHQAGLAHSDLSCNNVLIDPKTGSCIVIDIDSLVVPNIFPPEVIGTYGYIAPEVMATMGLPWNHVNRCRPSAYTDQYALAVLIYEYIFCRHPLIGPKDYGARSEREHDFFAMGSKATFIENPYDKSNRPNNLRMTISDFGKELESLFLRAFVEGIHNPEERPTAMEWEKGLSNTIDILHKCPNRLCEKKWFVFHDNKKPMCSYCGGKIKNEEIIRIGVNKSIGRGQWINIKNIILGENMPIYKWHIYDNVFQNEKVDRTVQAVIIKKDGNWHLENKSATGLISPKGYIIPSGKSIQINDGDIFSIREKNGVVMDIHIDKY